MNVAQLVAILQQQPQDATVMIWEAYNDRQTTDVIVSRNAEGVWIDCNAHGEES